MVHLQVLDDYSGLSVLQGIWRNLSYWLLCLLELNSVLLLLIFYWIIVIMLILWYNYVLWYYYRFLFLFFLIKIVLPGYKDASGSFIRFSRVSASSVEAIVSGGIRLLFYLLLSTAILFFPETQLTAVKISTLQLLLLIHYS